MASFCSFEYSTFNSNLHGQGLRADVDVKEKDVVFMEKPLFMLQTIPNRKHVLACGNCYKFLGGLNIQSQFLLQNVSRQDDLSVHNVPIFDETTSSLTDIIPCKYCCGEYYCSSACRDCHCNDRGHELLCTGQIRDDEAESHPLIQFKMHAITTNEIFLLVAQIFASFCQSADKLVKSGWTVELAIKEVASIFDGYVKELWWDAAKTPKDSDPDEFKNKLKQLVADAYTLLNKCLKLAVKGYSLVLNEEYMSRMIGMFEQNNVGVRMSNPLAHFASDLEISSDHIADFSSVALSIIEKIDCEECDDDSSGSSISRGSVISRDSVIVKADPNRNSLSILHELLDTNDIDNVFPPLDGTAFYLEICKINHSCVPNVLACYNYEENREVVAELTVIAPISAGDELLQSYIDQSLPFRERSEALEDYGFTCSCRKCVDQI